MAENKIDAEALKSANDIGAVIGRYIDLKPRGKNLEGLCPFHDEKSPSFKVNSNKQFFKCFGCGASGDVIDFVQRIEKIDFHAACAKLGGNEFPEAKLAQPIKVVEDPWKQIPYSDGELSDDDRTFYHYGLKLYPTATYPFYNGDGQFVGYTCRFDLPDGGKEVLPLTYVTNGQTSQWMWKGFKAPRPLFNRYQLVMRPEAGVLVVEGEKTARVAEQMFPKMVVVTWIGGTNAIQYTDWTPLYDRGIVFWPDYDATGYNAMLKIASLLREHANYLKWIRPPEGSPKGWDLADATWTVDECRAYSLSVLDNLPETVPFPEFQTLAEDPQPPIELAYLPEVTERQGKDIPTSGSDELPFSFLGWDKTDSGKANYYFYVFKKKTILSIAGSAMSTTALLELAPLTTWEMMFPAKKGGEFRLSLAINWIIRESDKVGPFKPSLRGRGVWHDRGRIVIHNGRYLIVDGEQKDLTEIQSQHTYENGPDLGFELTKPLSAEDGLQLFRLVSELNWERQINASLLLGWCVLAPVCGALSWRPHIWLTGARGSGKTWVFMHILRRLLGNTVLAVQGMSTEAGLRQTLRHDAIPIVFDEAEDEGPEAQMRIQRVMTLMRIASADDGGLLVKGTSGGHAQTFRIRSCFAFASIVVQLKQQSDISRVTVLGMIKRDGDAHYARFKKIEKEYNELVTEDFVLALRTRTVQMLPIIKSNIAVFRSAATAILGEARAGDQIGTLLAGAYSLFNDTVATPGQAEAFITGVEDWEEERTRTETDESKLLSYILEKRERVETGHGAITRNISELIKIGSNSMNMGETITADLARDTLERCGIKVNNLEKVFMISNTHSVIKDWLKNTAYAQNHNKVLLRLPGSFSPTAPQRFGSGTPTRCVAIPLSVLEDK